MPVEIGRIDVGYSQVSRQIAVHTALPDDTLLLHSVDHTEALGRPSVTHLDMRSTNPAIDPNEVLGQAVAVRIDSAVGGDPRWIHGYMWSFESVGQVGGLWRYRAEVRPWLSMMSANREYRVFLQKTAAGVVDAMLRPHSGTMDVQLNLFETGYRTRDFCAQYAESDFNFVSRLLEDDGIYYHFEYTRDGETLVLCDDSTQHEERPGGALMPYQPTQRPGQTTTDPEAVTSFVRTSAYRCARYGVVDYCAVRPTTYLVELCEGEFDHGPSGRQRYGWLEAFPGHQTSAEGALYARLRKEERETTADLYRGQTPSRRLAPGMQIGLSQHPGHEESERFLVTGVHISAMAAAWEPGADGDGSLDFSCSFEAIPATRPFRPQRVTPKPKAEMQTAFVTTAADGADTPDLAKDDYCCVRVKFHWDHWTDDRHPVGDQENVTDAGTSCWIRTSQAWAGKGWGWVSNPHPGQEVIIDFINGDPDRPIVVGRVYNEENRPMMNPADNCLKMQLRDSGQNHIVLGAETDKQVIEMFSPSGNTTIRIGG